MSRETDFQRVVLQVNIRPYGLFCFTDSRAGERQKSDEVGAIFRLRRAGSFGQGYDAVKLFGAWQPDWFFKNVHAPDFVGAIVVVRKSCQFEDTAEGVHGVVKNRWRILIRVSGLPYLTMFFLEVAGLHRVQFGERILTSLLAEFLPRLVWVE
jgi:hypothetical protein